MQLELVKIINSLKNIISKKIMNITDKSGKQKEETFAAPNSILTNLGKLVKKRSDTINQFTKKKTVLKKLKHFLMHPKRQQRAFQNKNLVNQFQTG